MNDLYVGVSVSSSSLLLAIYHSWWPLEDGEESCRPSGFSSEQLLWVFSISCLCFSLPSPLSRLSQYCSPSRSQWNWGDAESVQNGDETPCKENMFLFKTNSDIMAAPPLVHLDALSLLKWSFCCPFTELIPQQHRGFVQENCLFIEESYSHSTFGVLGAFAPFSNNCDCQASVKKTNLFKKCMMEWIFHLIFHWCLNMMKQSALRASDRWSSGYE